MLKQIALGMVLLASLLAGTAWADDAMNKALFEAAGAKDGKGDRAKVEALIIRGANVNAKDSILGFTMLHWVGKEVAELLIAKGADVNAKDKDGKTPLHTQYSKEIAGLLISNGADVNAKDRSEETPLHHMAIIGNKEVAELLIAKGSNVNAKNDMNYTPLYKAVIYGKKEVAELLLSKGADVNAKIYRGETLLHTAVGQGNKEIIELLIAKGADVNAKTIDGNTPLHSVAYKGKKEVAELLIANGADLNAKDKYGNTPLHEAARSGEKEVAEFLILKGADVSAKADVGTPLDRAISEGKKEVVVLLQSELQKQKEMPALLQAALQNQSGNQREIFSRVMVNYKDRAMSDDIRRPFIALAAKLKPAPAVPEEARKYLIRGNALMQDAKNPGEARAAIQEYQNALLAAPWWDDAYYNLSKAQELAGDLDGAYSSMQYYLLTNPQDKREAQDRLYALEAKRDKAKGK